MTHAPTTVADGRYELQQLVIEGAVTELWRAGVSLSYHTDNRLMSCITHSGEALALLQETPLTVDDLLAMTRQAALHSFLPAAQREAALRAIEVFQPGS